jgi:hypothetical protein
MADQARKFTLNDGSRLVIQVGAGRRDRQPSDVECVSESDF